MISLEMELSNQEETISLLHCQALINIGLASLVGLGIDPSTNSNLREFNAIFMERDYKLKLSSVEVDKPKQD